MTDIPDEDSPTSFIVTFAPNPVLEKLYDAVGIQTICLDPEGTAISPSQRSTLLSDFMFRLAELTANDGRVLGHPDQPLFFGQALADAIKLAISEVAKKPELRSMFGRRDTSRIAYLFTEVLRRTIPGCFQEFIRSLLFTDFKVTFIPDFIRIAIKYSNQFGKDALVTKVCARALEREETREPLFEANVNWNVIWGEKLQSKSVEEFIERFESELEVHETDCYGVGPDPNIAFFVDVAKRIINGEISNPLTETATEKLAKLLNRVATLYPPALPYVPNPAAPPSVEAIQQSIDERIKSLGLATDDHDEPG